MVMAFTEMGRFIAILAFQLTLLLSGGVENFLGGLNTTHFGKGAKFGIMIV